MSEQLDMITTVCGGVFLILLFGMFFAHESLRRYRKIYRFGYFSTALFGIIAALLMTIPSDEHDLVMKIIMVSFYILCGTPILVYNFIGMIRGEGQLVQSTLEHCTLEKVFSGKRVNYRISGTSKEGNKNSFLLQYPADKKPFKDNPITDNTVAVIQYYEEGNSIFHVKRID